MGIWCLRCLSLAHPPLVVTLYYIREQGGSDFQKVLRFRFRLLTRGESLSLAHPPLVVTLCYITNTPCITSLHHITPALSTSDDIMVRFDYDLSDCMVTSDLRSIPDLLITSRTSWCFIIIHHITLSYHLLMTSRTSRTSQCYIIITISPVCDLQDLTNEPHSVTS